MGGLVYDTGALVAAARGQAAVWHLHRRALERNEGPLVLAPVLARAWGETGGADLLAVFLRGCALADFPVAAAYDAGRLLARSGTTDLVVAAVVLAALTTRSAVVTADPEGVRGLARVLGVDLPVAALPGAEDRDSTGGPSRSVSSAAGGVG
jgi:hypothetical protein